MTLGSNLQKLKVVDADITELQVDVIVNAANKTLLGGGGVDGAIHAKAGPLLKQACEAFGGCETGEARITPGFDLPAAYVIHAVGPVWQGGEADEAALLAQCYRRSLGLAAGNQLSTIAFPAISTGAFGYPADEAAAIAVRTTLKFLATTDVLEQVIFCCFGEEAVASYDKALAEIKEAASP
ncbi:MAG: O-acetyl-ADP-ribose deacetylase [Magnetovibrionaceae bacterium]